MALTLTGLQVTGATAAGAPKIKLAGMDPVLVGSTYSVSGRLARTGSRNNKTVVLQWRSTGAWHRLAVKRRQDDGPFRFYFSSAAAGAPQFRALVRIGRRTLDRSPARTLSVVNAPAEPVVTTPAVPGAAGPTSNLTLSGGSQTMANFLSFVLGDVQRYWDRVWDQYALPRPTFNYYFPPAGVAFYHSCEPTGVYAEDDAAHYCPRDDYIIISEALATKVWLGQFGNYGQTGDRSGDFSVAFVVAHEYAHNLQWELKLFDAGLPTRSYELHADCWAGTWANGAYYEGILEAGDIEEALDTAALVGEYEFYSPGHHGTPEERQSAFLTGYNSGQPTDCNVYLQ